MSQNKYSNVPKIKHYPSSIKEWPNSLYLYNKKDIKNISIKNKLASRLMKSYFNLSNDLNIARSKRMRTLLKRFSSKKVFVSKVEIKQYNDKYSLNVYLYNRAKQFLLRKIYMFNRNKYLYKKWKRIRFINSPYMFTIKHGHRNRFLKKFLRKSRSYFNIYMNNQINSYLFKFRNWNKIANVFFYKLLLKSNIDKTTLNTNIFNIVTLIKNNVQLVKDRNKLLYLIQKCYRIYYANFISKLNKNRVRRKILLTKTMYIKFIINQFKFNKFLPKLKMLLENIFNKKVELNIVDLKYLHLNSDIFVDSLTTKAKKRKTVKQIFKKSLNLVKTPKSFVETETVNFLPELYRYKKFNVDHLHNIYNAYTTSPYSNKVKHTKKKDLLDKFLLSMYTFPISYQGKYIHSSRNKYVNIINSIKHKWLTGVRLEGGGRLTRRFTASRSVHYLEYKGSLKYVNYNRELATNRNLSTVLLRNVAKSNSQYTLSNSKKHIGAYGIKGWISSK